jgi:hypothetical protein
MLAFKRALIAAFKSLLLPGNISFGLLAVVGAVVTGPFDTLSRLTFGERVVYWSGVVVFSVFTATLAQKLLADSLRDASDGLTILLDSTVMTVLFSPVAYFWTVLFFDIGVNRGDFVHVVMNVMLVALVIFACRQLVFDWAKVSTFERAQSGAIPNLQQSEGDTVQAPPRLARRLAEDDPGPIRRIEAMDHFVTVYTEKDSYQLRLRFADAVDEMDGVPGLVTHRSHWVAQQFVDDVERQNGRLMLRLTCGARVPVSRKYRPALQEAGLV